MGKGLREIDVARPVVAWLQQEGWEVYQEVKTIHDYIADIIAVRGDHIWVIEAKTSLTFSLVEQAMRWGRYSHLQSVAVPYSKSPRHLAQRVLSDLNIGLFLVQGNQIRRPINFQPSTSVSPTDIARIRNSLKLEHKTTAPAGSPSDVTRWTPFQATCRSVLNYAKENPGSRLVHLVHEIQHHYKTSQSAAGSLAKWIRKGVVPGVELRRRRDGKGPFRVYPTKR